MKKLVFLVTTILSAHCFAGTARIKGEVHYYHPYYLSTILKVGQCTGTGDGLTEDEAYSAAKASCESNFKDPQKFILINVRYEGNFPGYGPSEEELKDIMVDYENRSAQKKLKQDFNELKEKLELIEKEKALLIETSQAEKIRLENELAKLQKESTDKELDLRLKIKDLTLRGEAYLYELNICSADLEQSQANNLKVIATDRKARQLKLVYDEIKTELTSTQLE